MEGSSSRYFFYIRVSYAFVRRVTVGDEIRKKYHSSEWKERRQEILKRDNFECQRCGDDSDGLHILDIGIALDPNASDPYTRAFLTVAATFAELEAAIKRKYGREGIAAAREQGKWHGRPPFGFDVGSEGYLTPNSNYEKAVVALDQLDKGTSK